MSREFSETIGASLQNLTEVFSLEEVQRRLNLTLPAEWKQKSQQDKDDEKKKLEFFEQNRNTYRQIEPQRVYHQRLIEKYFTETYPALKLSEKAFLRLKREVAVWKLSGMMSSAKKAREIMDFLERTGSDLVFKPHIYDTELDYPSSNKLKTFAENISVLENPVQTLEKTYLLIGHACSRLVYRHDIRIFLSLLQAVEQADESLIEELAELTKYFDIRLHFDDSNDYDSEDQSYPDLEMLISIIQNGGLDDEEKLFVETYKTYFKLCHYELEQKISLRELHSNNIVEKFEILMWLISNVNTVDENAFINTQVIGNSPRTVDKVVNNETQLNISLIRKLQEFDIKVSEEHLVQLLTSNSENDGEESLGEKLQTILEDEKRLEKLVLFLTALYLPRTVDFLLFVDGLDAFINQKVTQMQNQTYQEKLDFFGGLKNPNKIVAGTFRGEYRDFFNEFSEEIKDYVEPRIWQKIGNSSVENTELKYKKRLLDLIAQLVAEEVFADEAGQYDVKKIIEAYDKGYIRDDSLLHLLPENEAKFFTWQNEISSGIVLKSTNFLELKPQIKTEIEKHGENEIVILFMISLMSSKRKIEFLTDERLAKLSPSVRAFFTQYKLYEDDANIKDFYDLIYDRASYEFRSLNSDSDMHLANDAFIQFLDDLYTVNGEEKSTLVMEVAKNLDQLEELESYLTEERRSILSESEINFLYQYVRYSRDGTASEIVRKLFEAGDNLDLFISTEENPELIRAFFPRMQATDKVVFITKDRLGIIHGEGAKNDLLSRLSEQDRRNAMLQNEYDRFYKLMYALAQEKLLDLADLTDIKLLSDYITAYGLSQSAEFFSVYKHIRKSEADSAYTLPDFIVKSGIKNIADLEALTRDLSSSILSSEGIQIAELEEYSDLEILFLGVILGKSNHKFDTGRPRLQTIIDQYRQMTVEGFTADMNPAYEPFEYNLREITIEFDASEIEEPFRVISSEILEALNRDSKIFVFKSEIKEYLHSKIASANEKLEQAANEKARKGIARNLANLQENLDLLESVRTEDALLQFLVESGISKDFASMQRILVLSRVFKVHQSPDFIESLKTNLLNEKITVEAILQITEVINEFIKQHVLSVRDDGQGLHSYWLTDFAQKLTKDKKARKQLIKLFSGFSQEFTKTIDSFKSQEVEGAQTTTLKVIPSRDFIAEMSGYIANVCYTKEFPLLAVHDLRTSNLSRRDVVPYRFVKADSDIGDFEIEGSVLVFEVADDQGNDCLLIRGFDYKNEADIDVKNFIEEFLDQMVEVGRKLGKKRILVPSLSGAISNYQITVSHIKNSYCRSQSDANPGVPVQLSENFNFNNYDLTNSCYVAREIK